MSAKRFQQGYAEHGSFIREISGQGSSFVSQQNLRWQQARYTLENEDLKSYGKRLESSGRDASPGKLATVQRRQLMRRVPMEEDAATRGAVDPQVVVWTGATDRRFTEQMSSVQKDKAEAVITHLSAQGYDVSLHWINRELQQLGVCVDLDTWKQNLQRWHAQSRTGTEQLRLDLRR
jgi:hypothetical protein